MDAGRTRKNFLFRSFAFLDVLAGCSTERESLKEIHESPSPRKMRLTQKHFGGYVNLKRRFHGVCTVFGKNRTIPSNNPINRFKERPIILWIMRNQTTKRYDAYIPSRTERSRRWKGYIRNMTIEWYGSFCVGIRYKLYTVTFCSIYRRVNWYIYTMALHSVQVDVLTFEVF